MEGDETLELISLQESTVCLKGLWGSKPKWTLAQGIKGSLDIVSSHGLVASPKSTVVREGKMRYSFDARVLTESSSPRARLPLWPGSRKGKESVFIICSVSKPVNDYIF